MQEQQRGEDGTHFALVDFRFPGTEVVVEVSGALGHSSNRDRAADAVRRNRLQLGGREVIEFTCEQVIHHEQMVVATLLAAGIVPGHGQPRMPGRKRDSDGRMWTGRMCTGHTPAPTAI